MLRSRAAQRHTGAALTTPEAAINFRSQLRLCSRPAYRSIVPWFHLARYFPRHAFVPFHKYLGTVAPYTRERQSLDQRFASPCSTISSESLLEQMLSRRSCGSLERLNRFNCSPLPTAIRYSSIPCTT